MQSEGTIDRVERDRKQKRASGRFLDFTAVSHAFHVMLKSLAPKVGRQARAWFLSADASQGGVAASISVYETKLCLVSAHLAAHDRRVYHSLWREESMGGMTKDDA
jgi:hypothetical protein